MNEGIWTVEGPYFPDQDTRFPAETWMVIDGDGDQIEFFPGREEAEAWLEFQQAAAEQAARGER